MKKSVSKNMKSVRSYQQSPPIGFAAVRSQAGPARKKKKARSPAVLRRTFFLVFAGICSIGLGAALGSTPLLHAGSPEITGIRLLTRHESNLIRDIATLPPRTNLFRAPFGRIAESLKSLPYVQDARVIPGYPPALRVDITPRIPVAVLRTPERSVELDSQGLAIRSARPGAELPTITTSVFMEPRPGAGVSDSGIDGALKIVRESGSKIASRTYEIHVDASAELCLNMDDGLTIRLGQPEELPAKIELIRRVYAESPGIAKDLESIDLRAPEAPACKPRSASREGSRRLSNNRGETPRPPEGGVKGPLKGESKDPSLRTADTRHN